MNNLEARVLCEEIAYMNGYADALEEIREERQKKQECRRVQKERNAKKCKAIINGLLMLGIGVAATVLDNDCTFLAFVIMIEVFAVNEAYRKKKVTGARGIRNGNERQGN